jgi:hypothetical protein
MLGPPPALAFGGGVELGFMPGGAPLKLGGVLSGKLGAAPPVGIGGMPAPGGP